ncbi:MAG: hypothetical protein MI922_15465 [Bacteroidales bacterium]|nr:hypothetical protein [Bacteroidales bacterium]
MNKQEIKKLCNTCTHKSIKSKIGMVCDLTQVEPIIGNSCSDYNRDFEAYLQQKKQQEKLDRAMIGKKKTILLISLLLGMSVFLILRNMHHDRYFMNDKKLTHDIVHLVLEIGLYVGLFMVKSWARIVSAILCLLRAGIIWIVMLSEIREPLRALPYLLSLTIYCYALYFIISDKDFQMFKNYQRMKT